MNKKEKSFVIAPLRIMIAAVLLFISFVAFKRGFKGLSASSAVGAVMVIVSPFVPCFLMESYAIVATIATIMHYGASSIVTVTSPITLN